MKKKALEWEDLDKMTQEFEQKRIDDLEDIEERKKLWKEVDALREKVRWYENNYGKKCTATSFYYLEAIKNSAYMAQMSLLVSYNPIHTYLQTYSREVEITRLNNLVRRLRSGYRIKVFVDPDPWINYTLEDAYDYLKTQYGARDEVIFLCLVKLFGKRKVAIGKLFYKPKRVDRRNKKPGHDPDDSTYMRYFEKYYDDATNRFILKFKY